jgi:C4-dicarboxylate-specific signal transduction histidine kinase
VCIGKAVEGALALTSGMLHAAGMSVVLNVPAGLPPVRGSLTALEQVLVNVVSNARDAMAQTPPEARRLDIEAWPDVDAGQVVVSVSDRGHGLPPGAAERAFEPFFTTKPIGKGTGLGLAIAYRTIRSFDGDIMIANREGGGVDVIIRLNEAAQGKA